MKKTKIVIPALGLLLLSTAASVTGTVAWFSANTSVNVSGMTVTTKVSGNILIATNNSSDDYYSTTDLTQNNGGILMPSSTVNGASYFYTKDAVKGDGSTESTALQTYSNDAAVATYYGVADSKIYADYDFYLKVTTADPSEKLTLSAVDFKYDGTALGANDKAWRVAIFADKVAAGNNAAIATPTLVTILRPSGALYFETGKAISAAAGTKAAVSSLDNPSLIEEIDDAGTVQRYKIKVRLWLEGEDTKCTNDTYATLTEDYTLDLTCSLGTTAASVSNI